MGTGADLGVFAVGPRCLAANGAAYARCCLARTGRKDFRAAQQLQTATDPRGRVNAAWEEGAPRHRRSVLAPDGSSALRQAASLRQRGPLERRARRFERSDEREEVVALRLAQLDGLHAAV